MEPLNWRLSPRLSTTKTRATCRIVIYGGKPLDRIAKFPQLPLLVLGQPSQQTGQAILSITCIDTRQVTDIPIARAFNCSKDDVVRHSVPGPVGYILDNGKRRQLLKDIAPKINILRDHANLTTVVIVAHTDCRADRWDDETHRSNLMTACQLMATALGNDIRVVGMYITGLTDHHQTAALLFDSKNQIQHDWLLEPNSVGHHPHEQQGAI